MEWNSPLHLILGLTRLAILAAHWDCSIHCVSLQTIFMLSLLLSGAAPQHEGRLLRLPWIGNSPSKTQCCSLLSILCGVLCTWRVVIFQDLSIVKETWSRSIHVRASHCTSLVVLMYMVFWVFKIPYIDPSLVKLFLMNKLPVNGEKTLIFTNATIPKEARKNRPEKDLKI